MTRSALASREPVFGDLEWSGQRSERPQPFNVAAANGLAISVPRISRVVYAKCRGAARKSSAAQRSYGHLLGHGGWACLNYGMSAELSMARSRDRCGWSAG